MELTLLPIVELQCIIGVLYWSYPFAFFAHDEELAATTSVYETMEILPGPENTHTQKLL